MRVPLLVTDFLRRAATLYPQKVAVVDAGARFTYADLQERATRLANALRGLGIGRGDRVCILSPNSHFFLESFYGTAEIGAILVPLNYRLARRGPRVHPQSCRRAAPSSSMREYVERRRARSARNLHGVRTLDRGARILRRGAVRLDRVGRRADSMPPAPDGPPPSA